MKARITKDLTFDASFIDNAIASERGMSELANELKTAPAFIEKRINELFEVDASSRIDALYDIDRAKKEIRRKNTASKSKPSVASAAKHAPLSSFKSDSPMLYSTVDFEVPDHDESEDEPDDTLDFLEFLRENLGSGLEYALKQMEADEAVGEAYCEADSSASHAALKKLNIEINAVSKEVSDAQAKFSAAQIEKTQLDERVERAAEKLRRAKLDATSAAFELEHAESHFKSSKAKLEELRKQKARMEKEIESIELPSFSIVPSGDCIVLKAVNYDTRSKDLLGPALKWSRRIGEKFADLSDSEFAVLGRLFGILSKLHGKYRIEFDPSLTRAIAVYNEFRACFE